MDQAWAWQGSWLWNPCLRSCMCVCVCVCVCVYVCVRVQPCGRNPFSCLVITAALFWLWPIRDDLHFACSYWLREAFLWVATLWCAGQPGQRARERAQWWCARPRSSAASSSVVSRSGTTSLEGLEILDWDLDCLRANESYYCSQAFCSNPTGHMLFAIY